MLHGIHALRFFAAFAVVIHHSLSDPNQTLTTITLGAAGVDVFFVISGLVIGLAASHDTAPAFLLKRAIRVLPLYWLATLASMFLILLYGTTIPHEQIIRSFLLIPDFSAQWFPIYFPAWTLSFELAFYAVAALFIHVTRPNARLAAAIAMAAIAAMPIPAPFAPAALITTAPCLEFATGLLMAEILYRGFRPNPTIAILSLVLGLLAFATRATDLEDLAHTTFPVRVLHWGVPAALVVFGAIGLEHRTFWRNRWLVLGGSASYAIYLTHVIAMRPMLTIARHLSIDLTANLLLRETILLPTALLCGIATHLLIERPLLSLLRRTIFDRPHRMIPTT